MTVAEDSSNFEVVVGDIDIKTNIDIKMELMHTVAKGVDIKFDHVEVKPGWLASSTVVDNSVIVAPWKGNFTVERFDSIQRLNLLSFNFYFACF